MEKKVNTNKTVVFSEDELSLGRVSVLIFIPAVLYLAAYVLSSMLLKEYVPAYLCLLIALAVILVPFEIAVIGAANKRQFGRFGLRTAFKRHESIPVWKIIIMAIVLFLWSRLVFSRVAPAENSLFINFFKFVPAYLITNNFIIYLMQFPKWIIALALIFNLIFNGIIGPVVEELYFRGYLMSRMERFGKAAPLIITILFSLYHLFTPWQNITRIIALVPFHYCVWKNKNLYIGMIAHCVMNLSGAISMFALLS